MSREQPQSIELPTELASWLDDYADQTDRTFESALARSVMALRLIDEGDPSGTLEDRLNELLDRLTSIESRVTAVENKLDADAHAAGADSDAEIEAVESRLTEEIENTRSRIIDVLREARSKADSDHEHPALAPTDHDHPALSERITRVESLLEALEADLSSGFDNYETILEAHDKSIVDIESEVETIGEALGGRLASIEQAHATRERGRELKQEANRKNVTQGNCEACGQQVDLSLLETPECPHCLSRFSGIDPGRRFIGRPTIKTDNHPALESGEHAPVDDQKHPNGEHQSDGI